LSQSTRLTDAQTDRQIWLSHGYTVRCITCSRAVKMAELPGELNVTTKTGRSRFSRNNEICEKVKERCSKGYRRYNCRADILAANIAYTSILAMRYWPITSCWNCYIFYVFTVLSASNMASGGERKTVNKFL